LVAPARKGVLAGDGATFMQSFFSFWDGSLLASFQMTSREACRLFDLIQKLANSPQIQPGCLGLAEILEDFRWARVVGQGDHWRSGMKCVPQ